VVIDYDTALGILNPEAVFNVGERLCTLLRLFKDYSLSAEVDVGRI
jgi:hypothetical protein